MSTPTLNLTPALVELVVDDMATSLAFYRRLGLTIPVEADAEPHVDVDLGGLRLAFDTRETILSFDPGWTPPSGGPRPRWPSPPGPRAASTRRMPRSSPPG